MTNVRGGNDGSRGLLEQRWPPITVAQANAISALTDPAYRNLKVTQGYHDLKIALTRLFGPENVTWCAYATWASKTAGSFIRGEEVPGLIREYLGRADHLTTALAGVNSALAGVHPEAKLDDSFIGRTIEAVMRDVTANVGHPPVAYVFDDQLQVVHEGAAYWAGPSATR